MIHHVPVHQFCQLLHRHFSRHLTVTPHTVFKPLLSACTPVPPAMAECCDDPTGVLAGLIACVRCTGSWNSHHLTCHRAIHLLA